jgi:hypothetical protein
MADFDLERTNFSKGEFSPTGVMTSFCLRKFYFSKVLKLKSRATPYALWYGSAIHKGVEAYYKLRSDHEWEDCAREAIEAFTKEWISYNTEGDKKRHLAGGIETIGRYCMYYKDDVAKFLPQFIETKQWVEMPNGTMLLCKIDRVRDDEGRFTIVDTKTSSWPLTDFYFKDFANDLQTTLYYYAVSQVVGECHGVQIDGIKVPHPPESSSTIPFSRRTFVREELQIQDALNTYCRHTDYMLKCAEKYKDDEEAMLKAFYCNQTKCGEYAGCEFLPICRYGFNHPAIGVDFYREGEE